jgi:hypothetical protein
MKITIEGILSTNAFSVCKIMKSNIYIKPLRSVDSYSSELLSRSHPERILLNRAK